MDSADPQSSRSNVLENMTDGLTQDSVAPACEMDIDLLNGSNGNETGSQYSDYLDSNGTSLSDQKSDSHSLYCNRSFSFTSFSRLSAAFLDSDAVDSPIEVEGVKQNKVEAWLQSTAECQEPAATGSLTVPNQSSSSSGNEDKDGDEVLRKYKLFKKFDVVQDYSDHYYIHGHRRSKQVTPSWTKVILQEWKILEESLPDTIYVRVYEGRMDLLRAVIVGAAGTPYHDGLFVFDLLFPYDYPNVPPKLFYFSGGLYLNRNLEDDDGRVCLSLLNTTDGMDENEQWIPWKSTVLQVLVSIQALVLNENPFFNDVIYRYTDEEAEVVAHEYIEKVFIESCKAMVYTLRRPRKHFEDFIAGHFRERAHAILLACKGYMEGAQIGSKAGSDTFKKDVSEIIPRLIGEFTRNGAKHCEQFLPPNEYKKA